MSVRERIAAWYVTGPLGHFVAGLADWAELLGRHLLARARERARARLRSARARTPASGR